jgi:hypothetical protein
MDNVAYVKSKKRIRNGKNRITLFYKNKYYKVIDEMEDCLIVETEPCYNKIPWLTEILIAKDSPDFEIICEREENNEISSPC